jgi:aminopeptidase
MALLFLRLPEHWHSQGCLRRSVLRDRKITQHFYFASHRRPYTKDVKTNLEHLVSLGTANVSNLLQNSLRLTPQEKYFLIYDEEADLTKVVAECYKRVLKTYDGSSVNFFDKQPADIIECVNQLRPGDIVIMVQSNFFRLDEYRFRLRLFERNLKNIEHVHLGFIPSSQYLHYVNALSFDPQRDGSVGLRLKHHIDKAKKIVVSCHGDTQLVYETEMEPTLLNIGDYSGLKHIGGTFPIGEVFSEPKKFDAVNGELMVWGYPNVLRFLEIADVPFKITIEKGIITKIDQNAPTAFKKLWQLLVEADETMIREFGLGLNKAMGRERPVIDVTAFERQQGLHISVGKKHTVYKKEGIPRRAKSKFHIDLFIDVKKITIDDITVFENGNYCV